ncbi:hypothetical protein TUMEXPCC7403_16995 [Tumidithrix helvetica PCC 7403]|uniref:hypothetical protein n=1 Tax=Tumidithrix helvetica TaxID=3457545 RepID=UPI003CA0EB00
MGSIQQSIQRSRNILEPFAVNDSGIRTIYQPSLTTGLDRIASLRFYGFITSLRVRVDVNSIPESPIPDLEATATRAERLTAVRDMEWLAARKELEILFKVSGAGWLPIASVSLLNRVPYYTLNLLPYLTDNPSFDLADNALLGARIINAGYGLLESNDHVTLFGSVREEIVSLPTDQREILISQAFDWTVTNTSQIILPVNPNRLQATLTNISPDRAIWLNYGAPAEIGKGITLYPNGGSYEINFSNLYKGSINAISTGNAILTGLECT